MVEPQRSSQQFRQIYHTRLNVEDNDDKKRSLSGGDNVTSITASLGLPYGGTIKRLKCKLDFSTIDTIYTVDLNVNGVTKLTVAIPASSNDTVEDKQDVNFNIGDTIHLDLSSPLGSGAGNLEILVEVEWHG